MVDDDLDRYNCSLSSLCVFSTDEIHRSNLLAFVSLDRVARLVRFFRSKYVVMEAQQVDAAERYKAEGAALIGQEEYKKAAFKCQLARMHSMQFAASAMTQRGLAPSPAIMETRPQTEGMPASPGPASQGGSLEVQARGVAVYVAACNNAALALLKLGDYPGAIKAASEALHLDPSNPRALYRRAMATLQKKGGDPEAALADLEAARAITPNDSAVADAIAQAHGVIAQQKDRTRAAMRKMFEA